MLEPINASIHRHFSKMESMKQKHPQFGWCNIHEFQFISAQEPGTPMFSPFTFVSENLLLSTGTFACAILHNLLLRRRQVLNSILIFTFPESTFQ